MNSFDNWLIISALILKGFYLRHPAWTTSFIHSFIHPGRHPIKRLIRHFIYSLFGIRFGSFFFLHIVLNFSKTIWLIVTESNAGVIHVGLLALCGRVFFLRERDTQKDWSRGPSRGCQSLIRRMPLSSTDEHIWSPAYPMIRSYYPDLNPSMWPVLPLSSFLYSLHTPSSFLSVLSLSSLLAKAYEAGSLPPLWKRMTVIFFSPPPGPLLQVLLQLRSLCRREEGEMRKID